MAAQARRQQSSIRELLHSPPVPAPARLWHRFRCSIRGVLHCLTDSASNFRRRFGNAARGAPPAPMAAPVGFHRLRIRALPAPGRPERLKHRRIRKAHFSGARPAQARLKRRRICKLWGFLTDTLRRRNVIRRC